MTAPIVPPLKERDPARPGLAGSVSTAVRNPPGKVPPSPRPSTARASANPTKLVMAACDMLAAVHTPTASSMPSEGRRGRAPIPRSGCRACRKKNDVAFVKSAGVRPVSLMIVGARMFSTWRSTNDSHEQAPCRRTGPTSASCRRALRLLRCELSRCVIVSPSCLEGLAAAIGSEDQCRGQQEETPR